MKIWRYFKGKVYRNSYRKTIPRIYHHELLHGRKLFPRVLLLLGDRLRACPLLEDKFGLNVLFRKLLLANAIGAALTKRTMEITLL